MLSLVWFKRDLRVQDHPALAHAAGLGPVLPVFVVEPELWTPDRAAGRQLAFVAECVAGLRADLVALGQPLILRSGEAVEVLARLSAKHRVTQIVTLAERGDARARARHERVADWARGRGLGWVVLDAPVTGAPLPAPALAPVAEGTGAFPSLRALGLPEDPCPYRQHGGRAAAVQALEAFVEQRGRAYGAAQGELALERAGSRLSAALAWGVLSPRELAAAVTEARVRHRGDPLWTAALRRFGAQLKAREAALAAPPAALPDQGDPALLAPWLAGETGLPFLDAAMRALAATGWLSAPARALVAGAALHLLRLPPAEVADALARRFTDHDPALLAQGMAAALAGRVPDPVAQGRRLDPEGAFLRRWLPELGAVPEAHLHAPWRWPAARARLAGRYPEPVIDPGHAAREARARLRRSRPAPQPRAVARPAPAGQLPLDL